MSGRELVNCDFCGRDTRNKSRICTGCMRGVYKHTDPDGTEVTTIEVVTYSRDAEVEQEVWDKVAEMLGLE